MIGEALRLDELLQEKNKILMDIHSMTKGFCTKYLGTSDDDSFADEYEVLLACREELVSELTDMQRNIVPLSALETERHSELIKTNNALVNAIAELDKNCAAYCKEISDRLRRDFKKDNAAYNINAAYNANYVMNGGFYIDKRN